MTHQHRINTMPFINDNIKENPYSHMYKDMDKKEVFAKMSDIEKHIVGLNIRLEALRLRRKDLFQIKE